MQFHEICLIKYYPDWFFVCFFFIVTRPWRLLAIDSLPSVRRLGKSMPIGMNLSCLLAGWVNFHPWENSKWRNIECKRSWLIENVLLQDLWLNHNQHLLWRDTVLDLLVELSGIFCLLFFKSAVCLHFCFIFSLTACTVSWYHNNVELKQSVKYMKRYIGDDYTFIINRVKVYLFTFHQLFVYLF